MSEFDDLTAAAEACKDHQPLRFMRTDSGLYIRNDNGIVFQVFQNPSFPTFMSQNKDYAELALAAAPDKVLAMVVQIKRLEEMLCICPECKGEGEVYTGENAYQGQWQPPEPIMEKCGECAGDGTIGTPQEFYALDAELAAVKQERDELQCGLSAAPALNCFDEISRLKAENEELRKDSARLNRLDAECEAYGTDVHEGNRWVLDGPFATARDAIDAILESEVRHEAGN